MNFAALPDGASVFIDANTLIYYFEPNAAFGAACQDLIQRIENQDLLGFTSTHVLGEVAHRLMTLEARALFGWPFAGIAYRLVQHPTEVQQLQAFRQAVEGAELSDPSPDDPSLIGSDRSPREPAIWLADK
jgi:predicted nucleic acid-binding protein